MVKLKEDIKVKNDYIETLEDEKRILEAAQDPWIDRKLIRSIAPSPSDLRIWLILEAARCEMVSGVVIASRRISQICIIATP